jgi:hypothetical protein
MINVTKELRDAHKKTLRKIWEEASEEFLEKI